MEFLLVENSKIINYKAIHPNITESEGCCFPRKNEHDLNHGYNSLMTFCSQTHTVQLFIVLYYVNLQAINWGV